MARLILSNLCLSFNILLLNTVLCKTPSTFISSRDLIKPVCSVPRIAKPFEPYFVCLLPEALKYCVCEPALGSHAFTLKVLRDPFRQCAFCFQWDTCLHQRGYRHCALHRDFRVFTRNAMNTALGGGKLKFPHCCSADSHGTPVSHRSGRMLRNGTPFSVLCLDESDCHSCSDPVHQEAVQRTSAVLLRSMQTSFLFQGKEPLSQWNRHTGNSFKAWRLYYCILGAPKFQWQFDYCHIWTKDNYCHAYETLSNKNQLLRYLKINLVWLKNRSYL